MHFIILITAAISVFAFVSQSTSALPVQDSHRESSQLSKRETGDSTDINGLPPLAGLLGTVIADTGIPVVGKDFAGPLGRYGTITDSIRAVPAAIPAAVGHDNDFSRFADSLLAGPATGPATGPDFAPVLAFAP